jgi:hypothetical protein
LSVACHHEAANTLTRERKYGDSEARDVQSFFDPGHGPFSSVEEVVVTVVAFAILAVVGVLSERAGDATGLAVALAAGMVVTGLVVAAPPTFADEWHYAALVAALLAAAVYWYRDRR